MKKMIVGLFALTSLSVFAADLKVCGRVQQVWTDSHRDLTMISIRQENGNDYASPISAKIKDTAIALANTSILNKNATFCAEVLSNEFIDVTLMNFKMD